MQTLWQDLRYGARMLAKKPGFTLIAVLTLALGIGANTAIFSVVNAVLLRPLAYPNADRLVLVWQNFLPLGLNQVPVSAPEFLDYQEQNQVFERIAAYRSAGFTLTTGAEPKQLIGVRVTASLFPLLGVSAALGRTFLAAEDGAAGARVVVLSHGLWHRRWAADPTLVGKTITLNEESFTVVGVMPPGFQFPPQSQTELWTNVAFDANDLNRRGTRPLQVLARLKPGIGLAQANAELQTIASRFPQPGPVPGVYLIPLHEQVVGKARTALFVLLVAVGFVLLIACANVANLLLSRTAARQRELAIRAAVGATRRLLIQQLLIESALLALLGGALGLLLAFWAIEPLVALDPGYLPRLGEINIDRRVLGFTLAVSVLTGVVFGLAPAWRASKPDLNATLKEGGRSSAPGRLSTRSLLLISEVALALVLLIGAGLLVNSFLRLLRVDPGFDHHNVLTLQIALPPARYAESQQRAAFFEQVLQRVEQLPGVESAGLTNVLPLGGNPDYSFTVEGRATRTPADTLQAGWRAISPDYFRAVGIPLRKGRSFTGQDHAQAAGVVIINETMARRFWPNEDPLGKRIKLGLPERPYPWLSIVGVVGDVKQFNLESPVEPEMYMPFAQMPWTLMPAFMRFAPLTLAVRAAADPANLSTAVRREILAVDKSQPVSRIRTLEQMLAESIAPRRFAMLLLTLFAALALLLAVGGIYSVMAYAVSECTHEIGVRMALGARPRDVFKLVIGHGLSLTLIGLALGLIMALALTRLMKNLLYGVSTTDPVTFALIALLLIGAALLACYLPARRATQVDPLVALRCE
jgi:predicted permease